MRKIVVDIDLVGYSSLANIFEQGLDVHSVADLNRQIQSFINQGLAAADVSREAALVKTTGSFTRRRDSSTLADYPARIVVGRLHFGEDWTC